MVEKAKRDILIAKNAPVYSPNTVAKALCTTSAAFCPQKSIPLDKMAAAVRVQLIIVSKNTSKIPHMPCSQGSVVSDWACIIDDAPSPA